MTMFVYVSIGSDHSTATCTRIFNGAWTEKDCTVQKKIQSNHVAYRRLPTWCHIWLAVSATNTITNNYHQSQCLTFQSWLRSLKSCMGLPLWKTGASFHRVYDWFCVPILYIHFVMLINMLSGDKLDQTLLIWAATPGQIWNFESPGVEIDCMVSVNIAHYHACICNMW